MATACVLAELKCRDGQREKICVKVERNLKSLISGVKEVNVIASRVLTELVEREKHSGVCAEGDEEESSDEDEEQEEPQVKEIKHSNGDRPPAKRCRTSDS